MQPRTTVEHESGVVLTNAKFRCTKCRQWKPAADHGLRKMNDGTVRNQAQCADCRRKK